MATPRKPLKPGIFIFPATKPLLEIPIWVRIYPQSRSFIFLQYCSILVPAQVAARFTNPLVLVWQYSRQTPSRPNEEDTAMTRASPRSSFVNIDKVAIAQKSETMVQNGA